METARRGEGSDDVSTVSLLELDLAPDATAPRQARHAIAPVVAQVGADTAGITLAVSEAVTRAVTRSANGLDEPPVRLHAECDDRHVVVVVENAAEAPAPADPDGAIGMVTLGRLTEQLWVERVGGRTRLVMRFPLRPAG
jgi:anti-sigma regulatory factor (Ser/Thr protein kinase)